MFQRCMLRDEDIEPLGDAVCRVLEEVGVLCENAELLQALQDAGARVDAAAQRAWFPAEIIRRFVESLRKETPPSPRCIEPEPFPEIGLPGIGAQVAQFYYDVEQSEKRQGNRGDFVTLIRLGEVLHGDRGVGHALLLTDVPAMIEPLEAGVLLAESARNPSPPFAWNVRQVDYLLEMGHVLGRRNWVTWGAICFAHPLRFDRDVADKFVRKVRLGLATGLTAMPVAGVTAPVTLEGFIAVAAAEHVATWFAVRAINPECPLSGSMWAATADMRGGVSYNAFDAMLYAFATAEFLRRWTGRAVTVGGGEYCDAREPGWFAAMEKLCKAMMIAAFQGRPAGIGQGMLECGKTICPEQLLIERDLTHGLRFLSRQVRPTPESLALDAVADVGIGLEKSYLEVRHTLEHFRSSLWLPELIDRAGWNGPGTDETLLQRAVEKKHALLAEYRQPDRDPDELHALRGIVERARAALCD